MSAMECSNHCSPLYQRDGKWWCLNNYCENSYFWEHKTTVSRFEYLTPSIGPVVEGLEDHEKIYALEQMDKYMPLRTLPGESGNSAIYRLELTAEQRQIVAEGGDVLVEILHFGGMLAPTRVMLMNQRALPEEKQKNFARWFAAQTKGPYRVNLANGNGE